MTKGFLQYRVIFLVVSVTIEWEERYFRSSRRRHARPA
jgi:hypothetical protein